MIKVGIVGLGFMGVEHLGIYRTMPGEVRVTAVAEPDAKKRKGDFSAAAGNIGGERLALGLGDAATYESLDALLADADVDAVDITLPTFMHHDAALAAFRAGKHVICEKPMALHYQEALHMVTAAREAGRHLYVGQCIRFWPAYAKAREIILAGAHGRVHTAAFSRLSALPGWAWQGWVLDQDKGGAAAHDLHIHDADFIAHTFGRPLAVTAHGGGRHGNRGPLDHISACYHYADDRLVTAVGAWEYASGFPFAMTFAVHMEGGSLVLAADGGLRLYRDGCPPESVPVAAGDGWTHELRHFIDCLAKDIPSPVISPEDAAFSVKLVRAELESARAGRRVELEPS